MISIVIPTAGRPEMLRHALHSIARQTAVESIVEIIVSENGEDSRSATVCEEFLKLPITYIFRGKSLPRTDHASALFRGDLKGVYTAMLHDDDWWAPRHLENALEKLNLHPTASAYYSSYFKVSGESSPLNCYDNFFFWFGAGYPEVDKPWLLDRQAILLGTLMGTGAIYSSLVAKTEASHDAAAIYDEKNSFDNDRMFSFALSKRGPIVYEPTPYVYYRMHVEQDTNTYGIDQRAKHMTRTTEWLIKNGAIDWKEAGEMFSIQASNCPPQFQYLLRYNALKPWCLPILALHADADSAAAKLYRSLEIPTWKKFLLQFIPPIITTVKDTFLQKC